MNDPGLLRVGVIGLGYWGPNLVRVLAEMDGADVVAVCDRRRERLDAISRRFPATRSYAEPHALLADEAIDAVVVATPISTHFELGLAALDAGKHVLVEKPLAASSSEAWALVARARELGLVLMPGHTFLYSPPVVSIHDLIAAGELGDVYFVSTSRVNLGLHQPDVSVVWDLAPHDFSILRYWLGETPEYVRAIGRGCVIPTIPDVAFVSLEFASGPIAHAELSWLSPSKLRRTTIVGSRKMVVYDDTSNEPVRIFDSGVELPDPETFGQYKLTYRTGDVISPRVDVAEPLLLELADFRAAIVDGTTAKSSDFLGLEVVKMIEAVDQSLATGARVQVDRDALPDERARGTEPAGPIPAR
jgi:predicted dehydrogenase